MSKNNFHIGDSGWRAIYTEGFTLENLSAIVTSLGRLFRQQKVLIGFDNRFLSEEYGHHISFILESLNWQVTLIPEIFPTPGIASLVKIGDYDWGLMITASHNPYYYNGLKMLDRHGSLIDRPLIDQLQREVEILLTREKPFPFHINARFSKLLPFEKAADEYLNSIFQWIDVKKIQSAGLKVSWDSFGGTDTQLFGKFSERLGVFHQGVAVSKDPTFQRKRLEPDEKSLKSLEGRVLREKSMVGLATDVDGDRFAVIDDHGHTITNNTLASLLIWYLLAVRKEKGTVYNTVSCSALNQKLCSEFNVPLVETPVGFRVMGQKMVAEQHPLIAVEETGGLAYAPHLPFKDGLMAHALVLEMMATQKKTLSTLIHELHQTYGDFHYHRVDVTVDPQKADEEIAHWLDEKKWEALAGPILKKSTLDGTKLTFEKGWVLIRNSKTEPLLRIYLESQDLHWAKELEAKIRGLSRA